MNLERFFQETRYDSSGRFQLPLDQWLAKASRFQFAQADHGPLAIVSAAVRSNANAIEVKVQGSRVEYRLHLPERPLEDFHSLLGALAACRRHTRRIRLACPRQQRQLTMTDGEIEVGALTTTLPPGQVLIELQRTTSEAPELSCLGRHCSLCPIPITLQSQSLQANLGQAYAGAKVDWSASVPELLRPSGNPTLATSIPLFVAATRARTPVWVAVVGGISYTFRLPGVQGRTGVVWAQHLETDLGLQSVVDDASWRALQSELLSLLRA